MMKYSIDEIFGDVDNFIIRTNYPNEIQKGENIIITNSNCEFEWDCITGCFDEDIHYAYIVDLEIVDVDLRDYVPEKSNNGGAYAYADAIIHEIKESGY